MVWEEISKRFGYHEDVCYSIMFEGSSGNDKMQSIMNEIRNNPFVELDNKKPNKVDDYLKLVSLENNKETKIDLPKSNVIKLYYEDGTTIAIRPSGTEAKIKFYIGVVGKTNEEVKTKPALIYDKLKKILEI